MENRVIPTAQAIGAEYYTPPPLDSSLSAEKQIDKALDQNKHWINQKMDQGYQVLDAGAAPGRANYPEPTSDFYAMERNEIAKRNYADHKQVFASPSPSPEPPEPTKPGASQPPASAPQKPEPDWKAKWRQHSEDTKIPDPPPPPPADTQSQSKGRSR